MEKELIVISVNAFNVVLEYLKSKPYKEIGELIPQLIAETDAINKEHQVVPVEAPAKEDTAKDPKLDILK